MISSPIAEEMPCEGGGEDAMSDHPFPDAAMLTGRIQRHLADILTFVQDQPMIAALALVALLFAMAGAAILIRLARAGKDEADAASAVARKRAPTLDLKKVRGPDPGANEPDPAREPLIRPMPPRVGGRPLVLHVDDSPSTLRLIAQAFSARADVVSVASARDAMRETEAARPDVVILEPALAAGGVDDFLDHVRDAADAPPVVIFSAGPPSARHQARAQTIFSKSRTTLGELVTGTLALTAAPPPGDQLRQA
jgi:CheY-like chemotaxis protein